MTTMLLKSMDDVMNLHREMDRIFESFGLPLYARAFRPETFGGRGFHVYEDTENVYAELPVPGMAPEHLEVSVEEGVLKVTGERPESQGDDKPIRWRLKERMTGRFEHKFRLPVEIDREKVTADYTHGILTVTLPKAPEAKPRKIEVRAG